MVSLLTYLLNQILEAMDLLAVIQSLWNGLWNGPRLRNDLYYVEWDVIL